MRVAILGSGNCVHSVRWANGLAQAGIDVHLLSAHRMGLPLEAGVTPHRLRHQPPHGYFLNVRGVDRILAELNPDVVNTHYASGYGTLGRLVGRDNNVLSVWGSDVFDFPRTSLLHKRLVAANLRQAAVVASISQVMKQQCLRVCPEIERVAVIPWGVDTQRFRPQESPRPEPNVFTVGTVKTLKPKYGVDTLIEGFALARRRLHDDGATPSKMRLRLVGEGTQERELRRLAARLGVAAVTDFVSAVPHDQVPDELSKLDLYVAVSRYDSESFGVAIVEALSCERPVIVSDAGGLPEVVNRDAIGVVVPRENPQALADQIVSLAKDRERRARLGQAGRADVRERFEWKRNVAQMIELFDEVACGSRTSMAA